MECAMFLLCFVSYNLCDNSVDVEDDDDDDDDGDDDDEDGNNVDV